MNEQFIDRVINILVEKRINEITDADVAQSVQNKLARRKGSVYSARFFVPTGTRPSPTQSRVHRSEAVPTGDGSGASRIVRRGLRPRINQPQS